VKLFVLDTSVAIAWYLPEQGSDRAREWHQRFLRQEIGLVVPSLHFWEFANVLRSYVRRSELAESIAIDVYQTHLDAPLELSEPAARGNVLQTAFAYQATAYDAVFIELALGLDIPLLTLERSTTPWVVKLGDRVRALN
jgi:predicted nucleic acid-binding protein